MVWVGLCGGVRSIATIGQVCDKDDGGVKQYKLGCLCLSLQAAHACCVVNVVVNTAKHKVWQ